MEGIDLSKYLKNIPEYITGRNRYNPVDMLKTVLFAFADNGYCSLRKLEDNCKVNMRYMYLMNWKTPSYRTFGYFINEVLAESAEAIFQDVNLAIFTQEKVDLSHLYIDGTKLKANANKYSWVWKKATEKSRYRLFAKITTLLDEAAFVPGRGRRKTIRQRRYERLKANTRTLEDSREKLTISGDERNS